MILLAILFTCFSVYLELEVPTYISKITDLLGSQGTNLDKHHIMSLNELQLQGRFAVSVLRKLMIL